MTRRREPATSEPADSELAGSGAEDDLRHELEARPLVYIDEQRAFDRMLRSFRKAREIAFDTEANSMFAYKERLCLVQISTRRRDYVIDPLAVDVQGLGPILADPGVVKVLHGGEFDVLLLKREHAFEIASLFDTKVAAASLGSEAPGLQAVLAKWSGIRLDKKFQRSDWGRRPLSEGQIDYARCDTAFLLPLADVLRSELRDRGTPHVQEVAAECRRLESMQPEVRPAGDANELLRVKGAGALCGKGLRALEQLNQLRHRIAERRDVPLFKVFGNDVLMQLARSRPQTARELRDGGAVPDRLLRRVGDELLGALRAARSAGPLEGPLPPQRSVGSEPPDLDRAQSERYEALRAWRKTVAEERGVDPSLVLSRAQLTGLALLDPVPVDVEMLAAGGALEPWRVAHYGPSLVEALSAVRPQRERGAARRSSGRRRTGSVSRRG